MINKFDTPIYFQEKQSVAGVEVEYTDTKEICQGGPAIGKIKINGRLFSDSIYFGGPFLSEDVFIYVPMFVQKLFRSGFKLCVINTTTLEQKILEPLRDLIFLHSIDGERIAFYEDLDKTVLNFYEKKF